MRFPTLLFLLILLGSMIASETQAQPIKLALVMSKAEKWDSQKKQEILDLATNAFVRSKRFTMIERSELDAIFTEKDLESFVKGTPGDLSEISNLDMIGVVSYTTEPVTNGQGQSQTGYFFQVRLTNVRDSKLSDTISSRRESLILPTTPSQAADHLLESVREMFPPEGYVIQLRRGEAVVDLGTEVGLRKGDHLEVIREGEPIVHPVTGAIIPQTDVIATLKVDEVDNGIATCKVKSAAQVALADRVRFVGRQSGAQKTIYKILPFLNPAGTKNTTIPVKQR